MHDLLKKLTIAIPVYNDAAYIRLAVESCVGQAGRVVIYDNCSTDGTSDICAELAAEHATVEHVRHPENIGAFENFKRSLFDCQTEYFSWVGSHDLLEAGYAFRLLETMEKDPAIALAAGTIVHVDEEGKRTGQIGKSNWANESKDARSLVRAGT